MSKNENKTRPTDTDIADFIASLPEKQQADAGMLVKIMQDISGEPAVLWGSKIIGFGTFHYKSKSGREGDWMRIGFAPGTGKFSLYLTYDAEMLTSKVKDLGKYTTGKGCVYINKLADVDTEKLKELVKIAYAAENPYA
jgi:nucleoid DNA-binding protein